MSRQHFFTGPEQSGPQMQNQPSNKVTNRGVEPVAALEDGALEPKITAWMARKGVLLTRVALASIFLWFGTLKFMPGMSEAEDVARRTLVKLTLGQLPPQICLHILAAWECAIGLGLLSGRFLKSTLILLFLQLFGTFLPLLFFPAETWKHFPYAPTLEGQYIIKNLVLVSAAVIVASTVRGGKIIADPNAARIGAHAEESYLRFRRRFHREPKPKRDNL